MRGDELIGQAGRAARWLARTGWRVTRELPGGAQAQRGLLKLENAVVTGVRRGLEGEREPATLVLPANGNAPAQPLRLAMAELLNRSVNTDRIGAAGYLFTAILRELVPDEARILAALADGLARPSLDVVIRNHLGGAQRFLLTNASTVGRAAGVSALEHVPAYVTRLHRLGVVDIGDEDPALAQQYDILATEAVVRDAEDRARARRGTVKIVRHTVVLSDLGRRFWLASDPSATP